MPLPENNILFYWTAPKSGSFFCIARGNQQHFRWKDLQSVH